MPTPHSGAMIEARIWARFNAEGIQVQEGMENTVGLTCVRYVRHDMKRGWDVADSIDFLVDLVKQTWEAEA